MAVLKDRAALVVLVAEKDQAAVAVLVAVAALADLQAGLAVVDLVAAAVIVPNGLDAQTDRR